MRLRMWRPMVVAFLVCTVLALGTAQTTWAQRAHSEYTPTGPAPVKGYEPYLGSVSSASSVVIGGVPGYLWRHGCGPTAAGMVIGFWEGNGFPLLIPGDASTHTNDVDQAIATGDGANTHYSDYSMPIDGSPNPVLADLSEAPAGDEHASDCIGDFMHTSWSVDGLYYGWSYSDMIDNAFNGYVNWANTAYSAHYLSTTNYQTWGNFTWDDVKNQINAGQPFVILVDSDGNGGTDHFVTVIGWRDDGGNNQYGCLDTWAPINSIRWEDFHGLTNGDAWGIHSATFFSIVSLNNPPVADAGTPQNVECAGATTSVTLDGTGSSDPDGDPLTYMWTATGVTFDDPSSATPTGSFPLGMTTVTLTLTDGDLVDTDTVDITIIDTTPPFFTSCATNITVECAGFCGTTPEDDQLTGFFGAVAADDICCDVTVTNDAPMCFPLGITKVTWTATDCAGNTAVCDADVTVEDTTPPDFRVRLNRHVLWPPNHKMATIRVFVQLSDVCCETPNWRLVSVTSNEPDNGKGDGNTINDIVIINRRHIELRSERAGGGDGRVYRLAFRARDCVGNTTNVIKRVRVPHDHSGLIFASTGFDAEGIGFDPALDRFAVVLPSSPDQFEIDEAGNEILVSTAFDATAVDLSQAYIGNLYDVILPQETLEIDNNADGLMDLALYYSAASVNMLLAASTPTDENQIDLDVDYGTIGFHYTNAEGMDYLAADIFALGDPVPLVPTIVLRRTDDQPDPRHEDIPSATGLHSAYPNPFNPTTTIPFNLVSQERVVLRIYNARGELVRTLKNEVMPAGLHQALWNGMDSDGRQVATGVYFVRLTAGTFQSTKKVVMLK